MNTKRNIRTLKVSLIALTLTSIFACSDSAYNEQLAIEPVDLNEHYEAIEAEETASTNTSLVQTPIDLKIIKSASARYKVKDVKKATDQIRQMATNYDAYISDLRFENNTYEKQNRFTIKVPNANFDAIMDSISKVSEFTEFENITTKDVTEEYIDLQSRLQTKQEVKERYETILRKNAKTVEDILATEDKLRIIQEEIEAAQGRLKYLTNKVAYSTIQVDLYETVEYKDEPKSYTKSFTDKAENGFSSGWNLVESIIIGLIHIWPLLIFLAILFFVLLRVLRKK